MLSTELAVIDDPVGCNKDVFEIPLETGRSLGSYFQQEEANCVCDFYQLCVFTNTWRDGLSIALPHGTRVGLAREQYGRLWFQLARGARAARACVHAHTNVRLLPRTHIRECLTHACAHAQLQRHAKCIFQRLSIRIAFNYD